MTLDHFYQGYNARKVISEIYASFVLQGTISGRMSQHGMGSIFHIKNQWNILVTGNYYVNYQKFQNSMLLYSNTVYTCLKITPRERTNFNMYAEYTQLHLTFLALHSCNLLSFVTCFQYECWNSQTGLNIDIVW